MADPSVYYIAGTAASLAAVLGALRTFYYRQRKRWTDEGADRQRNARALESNTEAAKANTVAITTLSERLAQFAEETRRELADHNTRIGRLENLADTPRRR